MKKIAVLICGQPRMVEFCAHKIKETLKYTNCDVDYFIHSYNEISIKALNSSNESITNIKKFTIDEVKDLYHKNYNVTSMEVTDYTELLEHKKCIDDIINHLNKNNNIKYNLIGSQPDYHFLTWMANMYSSHKANNLKLYHEKKNNISYDTVIKIRSDIIFKEYFTKNKNIIINKLLRDCKKGSAKNPIFVTYMHTKSGCGAVGDFIKWGPSKSFNVLLENVISYYYELCVEGLYYFIKDKNNNHTYNCLTSNNVVKASPESYWFNLGIRNNISFMPESLQVTLARYDALETDDYDTLSKKADNFLIDYDQFKKNNITENDWMENKLK